MMSFGLIKTILIIYSFRFCHGAREEEKFIRDVALDNRSCHVNERLASQNASSSIMCARICQGNPGCSSFFYNENTTECFGCDRTYTQGSSTTSTPGMMYYGKEEAIVYETSTCLDLFAGGAASGVYHLLTPLSNTPVSVYCDMQIEGGGWMVWQNRFDGSLDFESRTFQEYKDGFGDPAGEYWLGLEYLYEFLASRPSDVYFQFTDFSDVVAHEWFNHMQLAPGDLYTLTLGTMISANDGCVSMGFMYNNEQPFSTKDKVQNAFSHCPTDYTGGWWYYSCNRLNVNGRYGAANLAGGVYNYNLEWRSYDALKATKLMIREF